MRLLQRFVRPRLQTHCKIRGFVMPIIKTTEKETSLLGVILSTSEVKARKLSNRASCTSFCRLLECSNLASWASFCRLLKPKLESAQIEPTGRHFVDFWSQCQKMLKSSIMDVISSTSEAKAGQCSHLAYSTSFCRLLEQMPEIA